MKTLISAIQSFISHFLAVGMITSALLFRSWGNQARDSKEGLSRLIQAFTLHRAHDGHESKGHLKVAINSRGMAIIPLYFAFFQAISITS